MATVKPDLATHHVRPQHQPSPRPDRLTRILRVMVAAAGVIILLLGAWYGYAYVVSPASVRYPAVTHYHFRLQVINGGRPVNFADSPFQTPFDKGVCTAGLAAEPFHFHDGLDQFVHVHWDRVTGGDFLKHYGWNFIAGTDRTLGYRFDLLPQLTRVPIHGHALPKPPADAHYYIYAGDEQSYREQSWDSFLHTDLKTFFATTNTTATAPASRDLLGALIPTALAHEGHDHSAPATEKERLEQLNNLVGNAVIFVQKDRPTDEQIKDRFSQLIPLPESACAG